ncbi:hypothetical protein ACROYT_G007907 [Oculina patagonica]
MDKKYLLQVYKLWFLFLILDRESAWVWSSSICHQTLEGVKGTFQSSAFPPSSCKSQQRWEIKAPHGTYVELNISSFDVRQWSCLNDTFLVIRDDLNSSGSVLTVLCYKHDNFPITVRSSGNAMSVEAVNKWKGLSFNARYQVYDLNRGVAPSFDKTVNATQTILLGQRSPLWCQALGAPAPANHVV